MLDKIIQVDRYFFELINQKWTTPLLDFLLPFFRNQFTWVPVYFFLLVFGYMNFRNRLLIWIGFFLLTFALTDLVSTQIFKAYFQRPRPCWDHYTADQARMLIPCSQAYGFVSSHATNHFGIAAFIFGTLRNFFNRNLWMVFVWALLVSLSQIYVGAHFPGDIIGGSLLGLLLGFLTTKWYNRYYRMSPEKSFIE